MAKHALFFLKYFEEIIACVALSVTIIVTMVNVVLRFVFNWPLSWGEEITLIAFVWTVFVGLGAVCKHRMHFSIDVFVDMFPAPARALVNRSLDVFLVVLNIYLTYLAWKLSLNAVIKSTFVLGISYFFVDAAAVIGFGCSSVHSLRFLIANWTGGRASE